MQMHSNIEYTWNTGSLSKHIKCFFDFILITLLIYKTIEVTNETQNHLKKKKKSISKAF